MIKIDSSRVVARSAAQNDGVGLLRQRIAAKWRKVVFGGEFVPSYILKECTNITDIEILDSVTRIEYGAFV